MNEFRCWTEISLEAIAQNYRRMKDGGGSAHTLCVVKADAYRHGAPRVAARLEREGANWFAVANVAEGAALRQSGIQAEILVLGGVLDFEYASLFANRLIPVVHDIASLHQLDNQAAARGETWPFHLKLDSGMGRMGSRETAAEIAEAVRAASNLRLEAIMSHLATTSDEITPQTKQQLACFARITAELEGYGVGASLQHASASLPLVYRHSAAMGPAFGNMARPGLGLYGYPSSHLTPALSWKSRVVLVKDIGVGDPVGYGARWRANRPTRIAVVACGYADGIPHRLSEDAYVLVRGARAPVRGAVSMDLLTVDTTDTPGVRVGDVATIIGTDGDSRLTAEHWANWCGTIPYVILCGIGSRVARVYQP